jgi:hypothetical protein
MILEEILSGRAVSLIYLGLIVVLSVVRLYNLKQIEGAEDARNARGGRDA